jgi:beta-N-acetylhexosaminidase
MQPRPSTTGHRGRRLAATIAAAALAVAALAPHVGADGGVGLAGRQLSAAQLAGERVIYSYSGLVPPASLLSAIRAGRAAGVVLFADNIASRPQIKGVIAELQRAAAHGPVKAPLLIMTDQEGGLVRRLPGAPSRSEKQVGEAANPPAAARAAGRGAARNLAGVGVDVNLAPVLDVYRRAGNFIDQYGRSYSNRAATVASLGSAFISAQQRLGVAATAKHFPGLGAAATAQNTDSVPVTLNVSLRSLRRVDELPYHAAIAAGVRLVMVSWATYPALDPRHPAGLSRAVVQGELRRRLKFKGVTVTDALGAGGLDAFGSIANRARLAAGAGMDLLLCASQSPSEGAAAVSALASALSHGRLARGPFLAAAGRVTALRSSLGSG